MALQVSEIKMILEYSKLSNLPINCWWFFVCAIIAAYTDDFHWREFSLKITQNIVSSLGKNYQIKANDVKITDQ